MLSFDRSIQLETGEIVHVAILQTDFGHPEEVRFQIEEWPALRVKKETSSDVCDLQSGIFHIRV